MIEPTNLEMTDNGSQVYTTGKSYNEYKTSVWQVWVVGMSLVTLINFAAVIGILLFPLVNKKRWQTLLDWCVGLGVGSLSGSAIFHLLPSALGLDFNAINNSKVLWTLVFGFFLFYLVDNAIKAASAFRELIASKNIQAEVMSSIIKVGEVALKGNDNFIAVENVALKTNLNKKKVQDERVEEECELEKILLVKSDSIINGLCPDEHTTSLSDDEVKITNVAWMIIFGDAVHNFIDGLSIGAAFTRGILSGISVSIAVLCEELPHELGDVAILIHSGMKLRKALVYNLLSALTCYAGFIIGVVLGGIGSADQYIFALAGGLFIYISFAHMIPDMNGKLEMELKQNFKNGLGIFFVQFSGILVGLVCLFFLAMYNEQIHL
ncbi:Zinc transporter ZIP8 [Trichinella pseudospiralis]|uniref:Zinc transporter ZIP8 n=1 Tax=Trichinella pseudospiralis TaxID=6337 RepID=A0A0V1IJF2_TRIPS|nr:Zinc transporter ZIP8 [Trichinella pseudospiralis]KRZ22830.1 Zinc transporter ZIP8 [Trichinella pseudospiralis]